MAYLPPPESLPARCSISCRRVSQPEADETGAAGNLETWPQDQAPKKPQYMQGGAQPRCCPGGGHSLSVVSCGGRADISSNVPSTSDSGEARSSVSRGGRAGIGSHVLGTSFGGEGPEFSDEVAHLIGRGTGRLEEVSHPTEGSRFPCPQVGKSLVRRGRMRFSP